MAESYALPQALAARLAEHCAATGDAPEDVIADAVLLHLEEIEEARDAELLIDMLFGDPRPDPAPADELQLGLQLEGHP